MNGEVKMCGVAGMMRRVEENAGFESELHGVVKWTVSMIALCSSNKNWSGILAETSKRKEIFALPSAQSEQAIQRKGKCAY